MALPRTTRQLPAVHPQQSAAFQLRCLALYERRTTLYGWRRLGQGARPHVELFAVLSGDNGKWATRQHVVSYDHETGDVHCDPKTCKAAFYGGGCWHVGQVLALARQEAWAKSEAGQRDAFEYQAMSDFYGW